MDCVGTQEAIDWIQEKFGITIRVEYKEVEYVNEHGQPDIMYKWCYEIANKCRSGYDYDLKWDAENIAITKALELL